MKRKIVILFHSRQNTRFKLRRYSIVLSAKKWRQEGHQVTFLFGVARFVPADICFLHVDLSVVPEEYIEFANRYPVVVNGAVRDIRKSAISNKLVVSGDGYGGPVIVKTNHNFAGWPERLLTENRVKLLVARIANRFIQTPANFYTSFDYQIYHHYSDVPADYRDDDAFVVEKFLPETLDGIYYVCNYIFMGDSSLCTRIGSPYPIVKSRKIVNHQTVEPHPDIVKRRHNLGFGYGKFDYCVYEGSAILFDVNPTFGWAQLANDDDLAAVVFQKERALESFFK